MQNSAHQGDNENSHSGGGDDNLEQQPQSGASSQHQVEAELAAVTSAYPRIPLPPMLEGNIEAYFMSMDFWFKASGVTNDSRRYNTVMAQIPPTKLMELRPIIDALPNLNRYEYIKRQLINQFADSQQRRLHRVLSEMPLGDNRPSKLFYDMTRTANGALSDAVLLDLWAARLPSHAQAAVVASGGTTDQRVKIADAVTESMSMRLANRVEVVSNSNNCEAPSSNTQWPGMDFVKNEIAAMFRNFESKLLVNNERGRDRSRGRTSDRERSNSRRRRDASMEEFEQCWYHRQFGSKAKACREPCNYKKPGGVAQ